FVPLFESAADSSLSRLVDAAHLPGATAIGASVVGLSSVVGAALAGCLLALLGFLGAFILNALSFLLSLLLVLNLRADLSPQGPDRSEPYFRQLRQGFAYILDRPGLTALLACFAAINFFAAPMLIFVPMIVKDSLQRSAAWVGILETCIALGTISAAFSMSFLRLQNVYRRFFGGLLLAGLAILGIGLSRQAYAIAGLLFAFGWALGLINSTALAVFQSVVPDAIKGRFFSLLNTLCFAVMPLTLMLNGFLSQCFDFSVALAVNGAAILIIALVLPWIPRLPAVSAFALEERVNPS
ncbi:MAG: MFS transporter, partial [Desulfobacteraceae bacterium]